jgi:hypothetical protein
MKKIPNRWDEKSRSKPQWRYDEVFYLIVERPHDFRLATLQMTEKEG